MTTTEKPATTAATFGAALGRLFGEYPTDPPEAPVTAVVTVAGPDGSSTTVELTAGQLVWLQELVENEETDCRNAHPDQSGICGHCQGTGRPRAGQPGGWWFCVHHGEEGPDGEQCEGCQDHFGS
ncbi:hypothetical protein ACIRPK_34065 [Kitasatospora sp. NPDC101801]|uniref:hypothetical protein n=1 Tax=Bacillati TaxID=1783272 RepID=UPI0037FE2B31